MKLGEKVTFNRYYRRHSDSVNHEQLTEAQEGELEDTERIIMKRMVRVDLKQSLTGIVVGKRRMVISNTLGYGESRFNPDSSELVFGCYESSYVNVYLVAVTMTGFYRVPAEWIEKVTDNEN